MRQQFILLLLLFVSLTGFSQRIDKNNLLSTYQFQSVSQNLTHLDSTNTKNYTISSLFLNTAKGENRLAQQPNQEINFGLKTEGIQNLKKGLLAKGSFNLEKNYYKDHSWNLSYQIPEDYLMENPHYYAVEKPGNWNNQTYTLYGGISFPIKDLRVGVDADYILKKMYRTDFDPRPRISLNSILPKLNATYKINDQHAISASAGKGNKVVENSIKYSDNDDNLPVNTDIYIRWYTGYGTILIRSDDSTRRKIITTTAQIGHVWQLNNNKIVTNGRYIKGKQRTNRSKTYTSDEALYNYNTTEFNINSHLVKRLGNKQQLLGIDITKFDGKNKIRAFGGTNYSANKTKIMLEAGQSKETKKQLNYEVNAQLTFLSVDQQDALSQTGLEVQELHFSPTYRKEFTLSENMHLFPQLKMNYRHNLNTTLTDVKAGKRVITDVLDFASITEKNFYDHVILRDYNYAKGNQIGVHPSIQLEKRGKKQDAFLIIEYNYNQLQSDELNSPNRSLFTTEIGLKF